MNDNVPTPILVDPSKVKAQVKTGLRDIGIFAGGVVTAAAAIKSGNLLALLSLIQDPALVGAAGTVLTGGIVLWRQINARITKKREVIMAQVAPDHVAVVK